MSDLTEFLKARLDEDEAIRAGVSGCGDCSVDDLVAFLAARINEDEAWFGDKYAADDPVAEDLCQRLLREVAAKRAIIGEQTSDHAPIEGMYGTGCRTCVSWQDAPWDGGGGETEFGIAIPEQWPCRVARSAVAVWSGHPDYRAEWKP